MRVISLHSKSFDENSAAETNSTDSEFDSPSRQNAKRPRKDAVSDSESESSDIGCLINETSTKNSGGNETDILCDIAQDYV